MQIQPLDLVKSTQSRYTELFKKDKTFDAILQSGVQLLVNQQDLAFDFIETVFNIDKSFGNYLDIIGKIVGQSRFLVEFDDHIYFGFDGDPNAGSFGTQNDPNAGFPWKSINHPNPTYVKTLDDDTYKRIIKARIISNTSAATVNDLLAVVNLLTNSTSSRLEIDNNKSGVVTLTVKYSELNFVKYFYNRIGTKESILPIPLGVQLKIRGTQ